MIIADVPRFEQAIARFDAFNAADPTPESFQGEEYPKELLYARRMTAWLVKLAPDASEVMQLAARSQHLGRWQIPRSRYPLGREGYNQWRQSLYKFHAETAGTILREVGYEAAVIERVQTLLQKKRLKLDPEVQLLEDVACVVFLEHYFADFSHQHDPAKVVDIVRKTWRKMSPVGHEAALSLKLSPEAAALVGRALAG
jgi:hypothetical protein